MSLTTGRELPSLPEVHSILNIHEMRLQQSTAISKLVFSQSSQTFSALVANVATKDGKSSSTGGYKGKK